MSPLILKPMYTMTQWKHLQTRDGRLAIFLLLPIGTMYLDDGIKAELLSSDRLHLSFSWPPILLDADKIMHAMMSFCVDLKEGQGLLMAEVLRDFTDPLHSQAGDDVVSACTIPLPFPIKPDFVEDIVKFDGIDTILIYVIQFQAFEQSFVTPKKKLLVRNIHLDNASSAEAEDENVESSRSVLESKIIKSLIFSIETS